MPGNSKSTSSIITAINQNRETIHTCRAAKAGVQTLSHCGGIAAGGGAPA